MKIIKPSVEKLPKKNPSVMLNLIQHPNIKLPGFRIKSGMTRTGFFQWPFFKIAVCLAKKWWPYFAITIILILSIYLKLWGLRDRLHFDLDEATHIQTIVSIYKNGQFITQGPPASIEPGLYHGAFYYYLYLFPAFISKGNPLYLAAFTIILSAISVPLLYLALEKQFSRSLALTATILYGFSTVVIFYSRWAWNPNLIPFFFILALYSLAKMSNGVLPTKSGSTNGQHTPKNIPLRQGFGGLPCSHSSPSRILGYSAKEGKKDWWLIIFAFSLSSMSQLHIGASFFTLIFLLMIPFLVSQIKMGRIWTASIIALVLPWIPTIINEFKHNFALLGALENIHNLGTHENFVTRTAQSWNYFLQMYSDIIRLPKFFLIISLLCTLGALVFKINWRDKYNRLFPIFLTLSLILSFFACIEFDGLFLTHFSEQLFVLLPIITAFFLAVLFETKAGFAGGLIILLIFLSNNLGYYREKIVFGEQAYKIQKQICAYVLSQNLEGVEVVINSKSNPAYIQYTCKNSFGLKLGNKGRLIVITDLRQKTYFENVKIFNNQ